MFSAETRGIVFSNTVVENSIKGRFKLILVCFNGVEKKIIK